MSAWWLLLIVPVAVTVGIGVMYLIVGYQFAKMWAGR